MLAPNWFKVRLGPYLRRERDKRSYWKLFQPGPAIGGLARLRILAGSDFLEVGPELPVAPQSVHRSLVMRFHNALQDNENKSFSQVADRGLWLRRELTAITRKRYQPSSSGGRFIAVHVRMGDFRERDERELSRGATNARIPIHWYAACLDQLRMQLNEDIPAVVFSDGKDAELGPLLAQARVRRAAFQSSVTDLLQMGQGAAVIASGSGFSLWGAFLGNAPRVSFPGQSIVPIDKDRTRDCELGTGQCFPEEFLQHVRCRLDAPGLVGADAI